MTDISSFARFGKTNNPGIHQNKAKTAIAYTRVSSKEQADKNLSLDFQLKAIQDYAIRNGITIAGYFGGTYESAKTDGRKEFLRMLEYIKKNKGMITHILVYTLDRFSRTGGGAIKLAQELREKYGVEVYAVTQPTDTSNPSGVLQQSIHFIFSQYDNELRKQRAVAGMKEKFAQGIWATKVPMGYDIVKTNSERRIVVNATGRKLRKAFIWKSEGMKNEAIIVRLKAMGIPMYKQQLTKILKNPFYCGLIAHGMLDGRVIEGKHEKLISQELFLRVNAIHQQSGNYGVPHKKEMEEVPLKVFARCSICRQPFTGYIVKAKGLWYYKCRTKGCKCNKSVKEFHEKFLELLNRYCIKAQLIAPLRARMEQIWKDINVESYELEQAYKKQLASIEGKIENIEESYYVMKEMTKETFDKFYPRYAKERAEIAKKLSQLGSGISNPEQTINKALQISSELAAAWCCSDISRKEKLQKLLFPDGIIYDRENGVFRTEKVNTVFELIGSLNNTLEENEKGQTGALASLSLSAEREGFEPPDL
jgi:site-specific DNA recombinase